MTPVAGLAVCPARSSEGVIYRHRVRVADGELGFRQNVAFKIACDLHLAVLKL
jgi:hypothetical protein